MKKVRETHAALEQHSALRTGELLGDGPPARSLAIILLSHKPYPSPGGTRTEPPAAAAASSLTAGAHVPTPVWSPGAASASCPQQHTTMVWPTDWVWVQSSWCALRHCPPIVSARSRARTDSPVARRRGGGAI